MSSRLYVSLVRLVFMKNVILINKINTMKVIDKKVIFGGLYGLLIGDAVGRPYEFKSAKDIPVYSDIDMLPPNGFNSTYPTVPFGTWTDDGAQD